MATGTVLFERKDCRLGTDTEESSSVTDDIWDDKALITAFDGAISRVKRQVLARMPSREEQPLENGVESPVTRKKSIKKKIRNKIQWEVGVPCRAIFSEDGCEYEAVVEAINQKTGMCIIKFIGYDNEEEVPVAELQSSHGAIARQCQIQKALENMESDNITETDAEDTEHNVDAFNEIPASAGRWLPRPGRKYNTTQRPYSQQLPHFQNQHTMNMPLPPPPPPFLTSQFPDEDSEALSAMLLSWYMSGFHTGYYQGLKDAKREGHNKNRHMFP